MHGNNTFAVTVLSEEGESENRELAFVRYKEFVASLDNMNKAVRCMCVQWADAGSA